ncbi:MAG: hypothetical protein IJI36_03905, partial [Kiritimatiellae bacterium]|nr:hypothetical protein [Kiritimatiellia bacterium]
MLRRFLALFVFVACSGAWAQVEFATNGTFNLPGTGVACPYAGETAGVVLLAGGANFPDKPLVEGGKK